MLFLSVLTLDNIYILLNLTTKHIAVYPEYISFRYITLMLFHIVSDFLFL